MIKTLNDFYPNDQSHIQIHDELDISTQSVQQRRRNLKVSLFWKRQLSEK